MTDEEEEAIRSRVRRWMHPDVGSFDLARDVSRLLAERVMLKTELRQAADELLRCHLVLTQIADGRDALRLIVMELAEDRPDICPYCGRHKFQMPHSGQCLVTRARDALPDALKPARRD